MSINVRWEDNRRSGVALAMHRSLSGICLYGLNGLTVREGDDHPDYATPGVLWHFTFIVSSERRNTGKQLQYEKNT